MDSINSWTADWAQQISLNCSYLPSVTSTNSWSKQDFKASDQHALFLADHQTHGRGRGQNLWWNATPGATLLSTWCYTLKKSPQPITNMRIGLAVFEALYKLGPELDIGIKAPNDIYITEGKLAGILTEVVTLGPLTTLHIGIGLNIFSKPVVDHQNIQCWIENKKLDKKDWFLFCEDLHKKFISIADEPERTHLLIEEKKELLFGLKKYFDNEIVDIELDGSLILSDNSTLSWNEL